jgi:hypothetical protein
LLLQMVKLKLKKKKALMLLHRSFLPEGAKMRTLMMMLTKMPATMTVASFD